jgi:hypothetical protein
MSAQPGLTFRERDDERLLLEFIDWFDLQRGVGQVNRKPNAGDVAEFLKQRKEREKDAQR